jgi:TRAP-type transport system periplasmic protein
MVSGALTFASVAFVRAPARPAQFSWKCGDGPSGAHPVNTRLAQAFSRIRAETQGALDIRLFPNSELGDTTSMDSQLRLGALEMMAEVADLFDGLIPVASIGAVPFAFPNYEVPHRAFDGSLGDMLRKEFLAKGLFAFERIYDSGFREITTSTKPIRTVNDLQGVKLRVTPSKFRLDIFRSLGASPTPINYSEVYSALQTHLVDGEENPLSGIEDLKFYEVQKYCSLSHHLWACFLILVNRERWDSLPANFQEIMRKHINAGALLQRNDFTALERNVRERLTGRGMIFNDVNIDSFRTKLKVTGFYSRWRDTWGTAAWNELEKYTGPLA